uniref:Uncharacterized protein n=1 Tax=Marseillevirus LCMAC101 TaxID=2506602 RepID=A0A481YR85_9VIRU|nr:MAG: hypothetical protein LCMAC101_03260 [Marseillevirus LCMAC101]
MKRTAPKNIPKKTRVEDKLTWTEPLFPTGQTPSPKTNVLARYFRGDPVISEFSKLYNELYLK